MTDTDALPPALEDTSAATRFVYNVLRVADGWLYYKTLQARTGYAHPTISRACQTLVRRDVAERRRDPEEPRRCQVRVADDGTVEVRENAGDHGAHVYRALAELDGPAQVDLSPETRNDDVWNSYTFAFRIEPATPARTAVFDGGPAATASAVGAPATGEGEAEGDPPG